MYMCVYMCAINLINNIDIITFHAVAINNMCMYSFVIVTYLVSRAIKVWDFQAALDPRTPADALCLRTLVVS